MFTNKEGIGNIKMKFWFKNQRIKNKILLIYIPLVTIPLLLLGYVSNYLFTQDIIEKTIKNIQDDSNLIVTRIDSMLTNAENCANMVALDTYNIIRDKKPEENDQLGYLYIRDRIVSHLSIALMSFPDVSSIVFIDNYGNAFSPNQNMIINYQKVLNSGIIKEVEQTNGVNVWFPMQTRDFLVTDTTQPVVTVAKKIFNVDSGKKLGYLVLNINENSLASVYKSVGPSTNRTYFIADRNGYIISSQNPSSLLKPIEEDELRKGAMSGNTQTEAAKIMGRKTLVIYTAFNKADWKLVGNIPLDELTGDTEKNKMIIIASGLIFLLLALGGAGMLSSHITKPIKGLSANMDKIRQGNLEVRCHIESGDEIGLLALGFNDMIFRLRELLQNIRLEQKKKREYELALIQSQIKPHFLYNTLDLIYILCREKACTEAGNATKALADFYRAALSKGREIVTIDDEIQNVRNYLFIQNMRYSDVFDFKIDIQDEILDCEILKLTIQPLVENSLYHGLKEKGCPGRITIEGWLQDEARVIIRISDDGVGMAEEKLKTLLEHKKEDMNKESFGLSNVDERLKLYFGPDHGIDIKSALGKGTEITVSIPAVSRGYK